jgi:uncharacterized membrane protein
METEMNKNNTLKLVNGGLIAALYVVLTVLAAQFNLASGAIQVRFSEALTIMPVFTAAAVPGLTIGCVLANLLTGCAAWDVVFGSLATLIGAIGTRLLKDKPLLAWIPPVLSNMAIIPIILIKVYAVPDAWWFLVLTIGAGEIISCGLLGLLLWRSLKNIPQIKEMQ